MSADTIAAVLPVGDFETDSIQQAFNAIVEATKIPGWVVEIAEAVQDAESASQAVLQLSRQEPSLLIIIALQGLSANILESAACMAHVPVLLCPIQGRFALPSSALAAGALHESHRIIELIYGDPKETAFKEKLHTAMQAARTWTRLKHSVIGVIGGLFPNLISCRYDPSLIQSRFGVTTIPIPFDRLRSLMKTVAKETQKIQSFRADIGSRFDLSELPETSLQGGLILHLALKELARTDNIQGFATECWSAFPKEVGLNPCMGFLEDEYMLACEGDVTLCIALLAVRSLTGRSAYVGDLFDLDSDGVLTLVHCGGPVSLAEDENRVVLGRSQLASERGFETITCRPTLPLGPATIFRLYGPGGDQLHVAFGKLIESRQSPNLEVILKLSGDRWNFLEQCFGNHYVVAGGDIRLELRMLCKWLSINIHET